jgi:hypothetical protein
MSPLKRQTEISVNQNVELGIEITRKKKLEFLKLKFEDLPFILRHHIYQNKIP